MAPKVARARQPEGAILHRKSQTGQARPQCGAMKAEERICRWRSSKRHFEYGWGPHLKSVRVDHF